MLKQLLAVSIVTFSGAVLAEKPSQPSWEFGCKFEAQAEQKAALKVEKTISEVKPADLNTWTFEDRAPQVVASR